MRAHAEPAFPARHKRRRPAEPVALATLLRAVRYALAQAAGTGGGRFARPRKDRSAAQRAQRLGQPYLHERIDRTTPEPVDRKKTPPFTSARWCSRSSRSFNAPKGGAIKPERCAGAVISKATAYVHAFAQRAFEHATVAMPPALSSRLPPDTGLPRIKHPD